MVERKTLKENAFSFLSTAFIFLGAPLVAFLVESIIGWIIYSIGAIFGMIHTTRKKDWGLFVQFVYYVVWNLVAIFSRL